MTDQQTTVKNRTRPHPREKITARALIVWGAAVSVYIAAIASRTSFGVAGVEAIDRFEVDASRIAVFTAVQVGVYAAAQIPTGLLIDRFGPRRLLIAGALIMGLGQVLLGVTANYWVAIIARVLIGGGDATAFLSVMRLLPYWFPMRHAPVFAQLSAGLGQLGQFVSAVPFLALLVGDGWVVSFVSLGSVTVLIGLAAAVAVSDSPDPVEDAHGPKDANGAKAHGPSLRTRIKAVITSSVCWQAFFIHFTSMVPQATFTLLWGVPLMTLGMGLSGAQAGTALTVNTVVIILAGPFHGMVSARLGARRDIAVFIAVAISFAFWIYLFSSDAPRGFTAAILMNVMLGATTPVSNFGFDYVRERMPREAVATGTGLGNMGGFVATMVAAEAMGFLLDHSAAGHQDYAWADFRVGWIALLVIMVIGVIGMLGARFAVSRRTPAAPAGGTGREVRFIEQSDD